MTRKLAEGAIRPVLKWPPTMLEEAKAAAAEQGIEPSALVVRAALGVMTKAEIGQVQKLADDLHALGVQQIRSGNLAKKAAREGDTELAAQMAGECIGFVPYSVFIGADSLDQVSAAAAGAGFLRHDQPQPMGSPNNTAQKRSFSAFLRAAVGAELVRLRGKETP